MLVYCIKKADVFPFQYYYERRDGFCIFGTDLNQARLFSKRSRCLRFLIKKLTKWLPSQTFQIDELEAKIKCM